jgi:hypothetical protein
VDPAQVAVCQRFGAEFQSSEAHLKVGLALNTLGKQPLNGLRHRREGDTSGWYIWAGGEIGSEDDFFDPVHVAHLRDVLPQVIPYLGLPAGWRFQIAAGHEDVWFDASLLEPT